MDATDTKILMLLQENANISIAELAQRVNLSQTPCWRRIQRLEESGVIRRRVALLDPNAIGLGLTVFVDLKVERHSDRSAAEISRALLAAPEAISAHIVSGVADFRLEVVVGDLAAYERLMFETLLKLPHVTDVRSDFVLRTVKTPGPLPL